MAFQQKRPQLLIQVVLAMAGLGTIAPGCIAFATGAPVTPQIELAARAERSAVRPLQAAQTIAELPFIGTRFFNFTGGTGVVESIQITSDGTATVGLIGLYDSQQLYKGPFTNPILLNDGRGLRIEDDKVVQLFADESTIHRCRIQKTPCTATLHKPFSDVTEN